MLMSVLRDQEEECRKIAFELYGAGLTTAQVGNLFKQLYGRHYSKSSVSRMFDYAREAVWGWLLRPLDEYYLIVYIDALGERIDVIRLSILKDEWNDIVK